MKNPLRFALARRRKVPPMSQFKTLSMLTGHPTCLQTARFDANTNADRCCRWRRNIENQQPERCAHVQRSQSQVRIIANDVTSRPCWRTRTSASAACAKAMNSSRAWRNAERIWKLQRLLPDKSRRLRPAHARMRGLTWIFHTLNGSSH